MGQDELEPASPSDEHPQTVVDAWIDDHAKGDRRALQPPAGAAVELSPVGWTPEASMDVKRWIVYGKRFARLSSASNWWIGDWMRYGNSLYGEKYGAAAKATGYDRQTLMNMAWVSSRFSIDRRRPGLSWSHHAELAALPPAEQEVWLDRAEREHMTVRSVREEVRRGLHTRRKRRISATTPAAATGHAEPEACPYCGGQLPAEWRTGAGAGDDSDDLFALPPEHEPAVEDLRSVDHDVPLR